MKCPYCGVELEQSSVFCLSCGGKIPQQQEAQPVAEESRPQPEGEAWAGENIPAEEAQPQPKAEPASCPASLVRQEEMAPVISTGNWLGTMLLWMLIPVVMGILTGVVGSFLGTENVATVILGVLTSLSALIFVFVGAFAKGINKSKRNFFRAYLWMFLIGLVLVIVLLIVFSTLLVGSLPMEKLNELTQMLETM